MTEKQQKTRDTLNKMLLVGASSTGTALTYNSPASAIDIATVTTDITTIVTNTDAAADVAWPIGAALMALAVIGTVFKQFIAG